MNGQRNIKIKHLAPPKHAVSCVKSVTSVWQ